MVRCLLFGGRLGRFRLSWDSLSTFYAKNEKAKRGLVSQNSNGNLNQNQLIFDILIVIEIDIILVNIATGFQATWHTSRNATIKVRIVEGVDEGDDILDVVVIKVA